MLALVTQDRMHRRASGIFSFLYPSWLSHMVVLGHKKGVQSYMKLGASQILSSLQAKKQDCPLLHSPSLFLHQMIVLAVFSVDTGQPAFWLIQSSFIPAIIQDLGQKMPAV